MKRNVIFNIENQNKIHFGKINDWKLNFRFKNKYEKISLSEGDKFIILEKDSSGRLTFTYYGKIISKESNNAAIKYGEKKFVHDLILEIKGLLNEDNLLEDYYYSLEIIKNFKNPYVHFQQSYRLIKDNDFDTIINKKINIPRSFFGILFNVLPREHKLNFISSIIKDEGDLIFSNYDYIKIGNYFSDYIKSNILDLSDYLLESWSMLNEIGNEDFKSIKFHFIDDDSFKNISQQIKIIKENEISEKEKDLINKFKDNYSDYYNESEFSQNLPLPIKL